MNRADVGTLAWALADSASTFIDSAYRAAVCAKIGAGEQDSAITDLLVLYGNTNAELPLQHADPIRTWIEGYTGTDNEPILRRIYDRVRFASDGADAERSILPAPRNSALRATRSKQARRVEPRVAADSAEDHPGRISLDGLDDGIKTERSQLIAWLKQEGFSDEQIRNEQAPTMLPARRALGADGCYVSARDMATTHGIDLDFLQGLTSAMGLPRTPDPDVAGYLRVDAETAARQQLLVDVGLDPDRVILMVRRIAEGLSRAVPAIQYGAMSAVLRPGITELQLAQEYEGKVRQVAPLVSTMIQDILFVQLRRAVEGEELNASERASGTALPGARQLSVAFADIVGFTNLGELVPPEDLVQLAERLVDLAREIVEPPVRLVKTIGDAVMLICPDPGKLTAAMLHLSNAASRDETFPDLRIGIAAGWAVSRARDWFGSPVNVASRVAAAAPPGGVLVAGSARDLIGDTDEFFLSFVGSSQLKGVRGQTKLFRAHRAADKVG